MFSGSVNGRRSRHQSVTMPVDGFVLMAYGQGPGPENRNQSDHHPDEGSERAALHEAGLLKILNETAAPGGKLVDRPPGQRYLASNGPDEPFQLPDAEETGMIEYGLVKYPGDPSLDALDGIPVEDTDKNPVFCDAAGFFDGFNRIVDEFEGGHEKGVIEGIVVERKVLC
jgi:hypothetical protein